MNVKVDENLPSSVAAVFREFGHGADTVRDEGLVGRTDDEIAQAAGLDFRLLVTLDRGFGDIRSYPPGSHAGIVVLRPDEQRVEQIIALVRHLLDTQDLTDLAGCNTIVQSNAIRIRRPR